MTLTINCDTHTDWPATVYATESYGDKIRALCSLCETMILECKHHKDITLWDIKTMKKFVSWGTHRQKEDV